MTKIIDDTGRDTEQERRVIEFRFGVNTLADPPNYFEPTIDPYQCEEIRLISKASSSAHWDIMLAKVDNNTYVYLGLWNDGCVK